MDGPSAKKSNSLETLVIQNITNANDLKAKLNDIIKVGKDYKYDVSNCLTALLNNSDHEIVTLAVQAIAELAKCEDKRETFAKKEVIEAILSILRKEVTLDRTELVKHCCRALGNLCCDCDTSRKLLHDQEGVILLTNLLKTSLDDNTAALNEIKIFTTKTILNYGIGGQQFSESLVESGVIELIRRILVTELDSDDMNDDFVSTALLVLSVISDNTPEVLFEPEVNRAVLNVLQETTNIEISELCLEHLHAQAEHAKLEGVELMCCRLEQLVRRQAARALRADDADVEALIKQACDLIIIVLTGDDAMHNLYDNGNGAVYQTTVRWLESPNPHLLSTGVLAPSSALIRTCPCNPPDIFEHHHKLALQLKKESGDISTSTKIQHAALSALRNLIVPVANKQAAARSGRAAPALLAALPAVEDHQVAYKLLAALRMLVDGQECVARVLAADAAALAAVARWGAAGHAGAAGEAPRLLAWSVKQLAREPALWRHYLQVCVCAAVAPWGAAGHAGAAGEAPRLLAWSVKQLAREPALWRHYLQVCVCAAVAPWGAAGHAGAAGEAPRLLAWSVKQLAREPALWRHYLQVDGCVSSLVNMLVASHSVMQNEAILALTLLAIHSLKDKPAGPDFDYEKKLIAHLLKSEIGLTEEGLERRSHTCGELSSAQVGEYVTICGWVQYLRLSKFLLLRDAYGVLQCTVSEEDIDFSNIPLESVVKVDGKVSLRPKNAINSEMSTGEIEVIIQRLEILSTAENLPFNLRNYQKPKEQLRMQHRYIDLRFPEMQSILRLRSQMLHRMRRFLVEQHGFVEVETPTLFCQTPGGAREFVVPTHHAGLFYSLVQSPQQFKQMLMSGGVDRYFQIARCYRDETTRPDRQPEFTQLDVEMSFTDLGGVLSMIESLLTHTFPKLMQEPPLKKITYKHALEHYGSDKPNVQYGLQFKNIKQLFPEKSRIPHFDAFAVPYPAELGKITAKNKDKIKEIAKKHKVKVILDHDIHKEFGSDFESNLKNIVGQQNSAIISMGDYENACLCLGEIRELIASLLRTRNLLKTEEHTEVLWVVDFPLFTKGEKGLETCHHPFTSPHPDDIHLLDSDPLKVRALAYDLVMNGNEIGGGSVRIHNARLQEKILSMLGMDAEKLRHFLNALRSGCPPHAGIALGIDRLVSIVFNTDSIRDVIAFPKTHEGKDPLSGAPSTISEQDKQYYHIKTC
ncbi:hypothetical protein MSG28_007298 [Choristoneura fumiferana]|uniref:Uncharacterized protein n=1 Tax=Choristoneura fumiferana TaxID=7141 RepID=A0ACC0JX06_CHOFU|nr:hypothetical protein MSG28_007298 [Choristoneura fumiferana]